MYTANAFRTPLVALVLAMACAAPAHADRYRVTIGNLPPIHVDDARSYATLQDPDPRASVRAPGTPALPPASPRPLPAQIRVAADRVPRSVPPAQPTPQPFTSIDPNKVIQGKSAGDPTPAFTATVGKDFTVTAPAEVRGVWYFFQTEPTTLPTEIRMGNAVVRWMLAVRKAPTGVTTAHPELLRPSATSGTVRAVGGMAVRITPWGSATGAILAENQVVELKPPAEGAWYRVVGTGGPGWVPGIWLELK